MCGFVRNAADAGSSLGLCQPEMRCYIESYYNKAAVRKYDAGDSGNIKESGG